MSALRPGGTVGHVDDEAGRWTDGPPLPPLPAPPADRIVVPGAQLLRVMQVDHPDPRRRRGYVEAMILAWARTRDGGWGFLLAWGGNWQQAGGRMTVKARWSWCRRLPDRVVTMPQPHPSTLMEDDEWHRHHPDSEFSKAVRAAVRTLPEPLRARALAPRPKPPARPG